MIKLKATLTNEEKILWPNQYVKVKIILDTLDDAVIIPSEAVQNSAQGKYVYVVKGNKTVDKKFNSHTPRANIKTAINKRTNRSKVISPFNILSK